MYIKFWYNVVRKKNYRRMCMGNLDLKNVAKETMEITKSCCFMKGDKKVVLPTADYKEVVVLNETVLEDIQEKQSVQFLNDNITRGADFYLVDGDSFQIAYEFINPLVMNFANANYPGGGFLNGAVAQEEALCRCSTLFASISSIKAKEMYEYNNMVALPCYSDYMLLSPKVCVFRSKELELLEQPYMVSVITVPAPNRRGAARFVSQEEVDLIMKARLRKMLFSAAHYGYKNLILGAWGCGAFGNDTMQVAGYFYDLFFVEGMEKLFENVAFAILNDETKIEAFEQVFGNKLSNYPVSGLEQEFTEYDYYEARYPFPICNHVKELSANNLGYTQGIMSNGVPFEAELWKSKNSVNVSFVLPELIFSEKRESGLQCGNVIGFHNQVERFCNGILNIGMVDNGQIDDFEEVIQYIDFLKENGLIEFTGQVENGAGFRCVDMEGNDLIYLVVTLEEDDEELAEVFLEFRDFPNYFPKKTIKVIKSSRR